MPLVKRGNARFWYAQFQIELRPYIRSTRTTDRKVAEKLEARWRAAAHAEGALGRKRVISLADAITRFIATKVGTPNHRNLLVRQKAVLGVISGKRPLGSLADDDLEKYRQWRPQGQGAPNHQA